MHQIKADIDKKSYDLEHPESFNELTEKQFTEVVRLVLLEKQNLAERADDQIRLLYTFLGGFDNSKKKRKAVHSVIKNLIENGESEELLLLQIFLYTEQDFNKWIIPSVKINKEILYGPGDRFSSMKFGEFISADMLVSAYFGSKDPELLLNKFIAVLYRKKRNGLFAGFNGDVREDLDSDYIDEREKIITELDEVTKRSILYNYLGVRNWLSKKYLFVFSAPDTSRRTNIVFGNNESSWLSVRRHLAGSALNLEKTDNLNLHDVLSSLNEEMSKK